MACNNLSLNIDFPCGDAGVGGIKEIQLTTDVISGITYSVTAGSEDVITAIASNPTWYTYALDGANSYTEAITADRNAGTVFYTQTLSFNLPGLSPEKTKEFKLLAWSRPVVKIVTNNGQEIIMGLTRGAHLSAGNIQTGAALGETSGYVGMTLTGEEPEPANFYDTGA